MNNVPKGLATTVQKPSGIKVLNISPEKLAMMNQAKKPMSKEAQAKLVAEDPPVEPVYSMSPVALKQGLAAMMASFGLGI